MENISGSAAKGKAFPGPQPLPNSRSSGPGIASGRYSARLSESKGLRSSSAQERRDDITSPTGFGHFVVPTH
jgi:hypothetical protein